MLHAETIPATIHWGWMQGWGSPWRAQCGQDYSFEAANEFGCAPIAEACHPNAGQRFYSPFIGAAGCAILSSTGRYGGGGGSWKTCPDATWTLSGSNCTRGCPAHASGTPCVCDAGYEFDASGTSCIPEQYTIALSGLGGEVIPAKKREAYAQVEKNDGSGKSGAQVQLELTVEPENGTPIRAEHVGRVSPNGGSTGSDGRLNFVFTAPVAGGLHTFTASCTNCSNQATDTIKVPGCPIPPLSAPPFTDPVATGFENGNRWRPDILTADYQTKLACVEAKIDAATGVPQSYTGTSAYRPFQYQQHLYEIVKKDIDLKPTYMTAHPECQALRDTITREMGPSPGHDLKRNQKVAAPGKSRHESGTAFDLTPHGLTKAQMIPIYADCGVENTKVKGEPWHTQ